MKKMKRILAVILCVMMLGGILPSNSTGWLKLPDLSIKSSAKTTYTEGYFTYSVSSGKVTITDCNASISGDITMPSTLGGYPVTSIGNSAFFCCENLTSITIPNSVTSIGEDAFCYCTSLTSITIPDSVTNIGESAFSCCKNLKTVTFGRGLTKISSHAFGFCENLESIVLPQNIATIETNAFYDCKSLENVTILNGELFVDIDVFSGCENLKNVYFTGTPEQMERMLNADEDEYYMCCYSSYKELYDANWHYINCTTEHLYDNDADCICNICGNVRYLTYTIENGEVTITDCDTSVSGELIIPSEIEGYPVTSIGDPYSMGPSGGFAYCTSLESVIIPNSVTRIFSYAFNGCSSLTSITIPDSITFIGYEAFDDCSGLTDVYITDLAAWCNIDFEQEDWIEGNGYPTNPLYYAKSLYLNGELVTELIISEGTTKIKKYAFAYFSGFTSVTILDSATEIREKAFYNCTSLKSIILPNSVINIGEGAFSGCKELNGVYITDIAAWCNNNFVDGNPLYYAKNLYLNDELVTDLVIPDGVTSIGHSVFDGCTSITSVTLPNSIIKINNQAFTGCNNIEKVYYLGNLSDRVEMYIGSSNDAILGKFIYDSCIGSETHTFDNSCDTTCNVCDAAREIKHTYDNNCDAVCNVCSHTREVAEHKYINYASNNDATCENDGTKTGYCFYCDKANTITDVGTAKGHKYTNACDTDCDTCGDIRITTHIYDNACDSKCNVCGDTRTVEPHVYTNDCDTICNICGLGRETEHVYDNNCDADCNECGKERIPANHIYDNACDTTCNVCNSSREITHDYEWVIDEENNCGVAGKKHEECSVCGAKRNENTSISATGNHIYDNTCDTNCNVCNEARETTHIYDDACDKNCNVCGAVRTVEPHVHTNTCDAICNICGMGREISHTYDNACDMSCNVCKLLRYVEPHVYTNDCDANCNICDAYRTPSAHRYDNNCDTDCNECGEIREITHDYGWVIDEENNCGEVGKKHEECSVCHVTRNENTVITATGKHTYKNDCDTICNVCNSVRGITHANRDYVTKATIGKNGSIVNKCSVCGKVNRNTPIYAIKAISLSATSYTYNGTAKTPIVTVKDSAGNTLKKNTDYKVTYAKGRKNVGTYKVTVTFTGNYNGTKALSFTIDPPKTSVSKLTAGKKALTVSISKMSTQVTGYEIQYATNKNFKSAKTTTVKSYKTTKVTLKKLSAKKTYYVRVRTYKIVNGKKYYSGWSSVKIKKTK